MSPSQGWAQGAVSHKLLPRTVSWKRRAPPLPGTAESLSRPHRRGTAALSGNRPWCPAANGQGKARNSTSGKRPKFCNDRQAVPKHTQPLPLLTLQDPPRPKGPSHRQQTLWECGLTHKLSSHSITTRAGEHEVLGLTWEPPGQAKPAFTE